MSLIKYNSAPVNGLGQMLDNFFNGNLSNNIGSDFLNTVPSINVSELEKEYLLEVAAPGMKKEDFKIELDGDQLSISAELELEDSNDTNGNFVRREFSYSSFRRNFTLPEEVDIEGIAAKYENGVLKITLPKQEIKIDQARRLIEIK